MQPTHLSDSNTLLTYSLVTTPTPVQVSQSAANQSLAKLTFVVSCPRSLGTANVSQIMIAVPVDESGKAADPTNLAATKPLLSSASISSNGTDQWNVAAGVGSGVFLFTPKSGPVQVSSQSLTIEIVGLHVNTLVGTALVRVREWAVKGSGTPPPVTGPPSGASSFGVAKFPYGFYAGNFTAEQPMIQNGQRPTLSWQGTNATYKMLYEGNAPVDVSNIRAWSPTSTPPSPVLTHMTTFILQVSAQVDGQSATIDFSITIEVLNPSLTVNDLTVLTTSTLSGNLTSSASATVAGTVQAGTLISTGNANVTGNVGIGTNPTTVMLDVAGTARLRGAPSIFGSGLTVNAEGDVGIGTHPTAIGIGVTTAARLDVNGTARLHGTQGSMNGSGLTVDRDGYIGIGTYTPTKGMVEIQGSNYHTTSAPNSVMFDFDNCTVQRGSGQRTISLYANQLIAAQNFLCFSDERIKNIEGISDSARDLQTLLGIEVTDFRYKDLVAKGNAQHKKVIAQQVEKVFPQAVSKHTDVVPDIYQQASFMDGWVELATDLKPGERVRLISGKDDAVYEVLEVKPDKFRTDFKPEGDKVFVFGREVNDFRTLDYDAIAMLNVSATQQLKKEKDEEIEALRAANDALQKRLQLLESKIGNALSVTAAKAAAVTG